MMKLSTMKKVVDTVDEQWESHLAETILEHWGFDPGTVKYFRGSANFVFIFRREGKRYFLRFNESIERDLNKMASEIAVLQHFHGGPTHVAQPVRSMNNRYIESVVYDDRTYYAVVFDALTGDQYDIEEIDHERFYAWGKALGQLHAESKQLPAGLTNARPRWQDQLSLTREMIPETDAAFFEELEIVQAWASQLAVNPENYGLIHYDFELDNLVWKGNNVSILDFDDCICCWFVADIAYALRDLFEDGIDLKNPSFQAFIEGYESETNIDKLLIKDLPMFMRMHDLLTFARLYRCVDIPESEEYPEWLVNLRGKLVMKLDNYRKSFAK